MMCVMSQISVEEQGRSLVIKIDREAVMKIAVNGDLFTLNKGMHELNLTVGGVPFRDDGLVSRVSGDELQLQIIIPEGIPCTLHMCVLICAARLNTDHVFVIAD